VRGEVYRLRRPRDPQGHEQRHERYAVVVQATRLLHLSTWVVIPTSTSARPYVFRPQITLPSGPTLALCDAIVSIDPEKRLGEYVSGLAVAEMQEIDQAMRFFLDLA
jgi:mRNA interferase MazF